MRLGLSSRVRLGFTLMELIVTVVILGVLAALAVPAMSAVTARSRVEADRATLTALTREAQALAAFRGDGTWQTADWEAAVADLPAAAETTTLPNGWVLTTAEAPVTARGQVNLALSSDRRTAGVAMLASDGRALYAVAEIAGEVATAHTGGEHTGRAALEHLPAAGGGSPTPEPTPEPASPPSIVFVTRSTVAEPAEQKFGDRLTARGMTVQMVAAAGTGTHDFTGVDLVISSHSARGGIPAGLPVLAHNHYLAKELGLAGYVGSSYMQASPWVVDHPVTAGLGLTAGTAVPVYTTATYVYPLYTLHSQTRALLSHHSGGSTPLAATHPAGGYWDFDYDLLTEQGWQLWEALVDELLAKPVFPVGNVMGSNVADATAASLTWDNAQSAEVQIDFRTVGTTDWSSVAAGATTSAVVPVAAPGRYEFRLQAAIGDKTSDWSGVREVVVEAPLTAMSANIVYVTQYSPPTANDAAFIQRLRDRGATVATVSDASTGTYDFTGVDLVISSHSARGGIPAGLPVLAHSAYLAKELGIAGYVGPNYKSASPWVVDHPVTAGLGLTAGTTVPVYATEGYVFPLYTLDAQTQVALSYNMAGDQAVAATHPAGGYWAYTDRARLTLDGARLWDALVDDILAGP